MLYPHSIKSGIGLITIYMYFLVQVLDAMGTNGTTGTRDTMIGSITPLALRTLSIRNTE